MIERKIFESKNILVFVFQIHTQRAVFVFVF